MKFTSLSLVLAASVVLPSAASAQVLTERNISLEMAKAAAEEALAACKRDGFDVTAAVVERSGALKVLLRNDAASPHNADLARRKAYTARTFKITSLEFQNRSMPDMPLAGQRQLVEVIGLGGGVPIMIGNDAIGGIGVSGGSQEADEKCARAGLAAIAGQLR